MFDESEWAWVSPLLNHDSSAIKACREQHGVGLAGARERVSEQACAAYERLTGFHETNDAAIYHHRLSLYGPPCPRCDRLLRTPQASFCASCGWRPEPPSVP